MRIKSKVISITLPENLLTKLDIAAMEEFTSRSEFIRQAVVEQLRIVDQYHAKLLAIANTADLPTEKQIEDMLRYRRVRRGIRAMMREEGMRSDPVIWYRNID